MRSIRAIVAVVLLLSAFAVPVSAQTARAHRFVAGQILVKFAPGVTAAAKAGAHALSGGTPLNEIARTGVQLVGVRAGDESAALARYRSNPHVLYAEPNLILTVPEPAASQVLPGDYYFHEQWALHNTGQQFYCTPWPLGGELCLYVGTPDADIDAPEAWAISTGSSAIAVAVIDTGVDYTHPDLAAHYAGGYDFVSPDSDPMDDHGHGTHVAGTIAASMDNFTGDPPAAEGVVGVAPNARILAYKVCAADGTCSQFAILQGIARAIADGARVINMSLGDTTYSQAFSDSVQDAWNAGLVVVAAAGNDGTTALTYPAAYDNVVSVAAFDEDHLRASFSNYGSWVDISAPGNAVMSTYPSFQCAASGAPGDTGCYTWLSGTSMASPHVAGAAALVWSRSDVTSNSQVVDILLHSADPAGVASVRLDSWTIHGGLNLQNALTYATTTNRAPVAASVSASTVSGTPVAIVLSATDVETCDLAFSVVQGPASGTLSAIEQRPCVAGSPNTDTAQIVFTAGSDTGTFEFTYKVNDGSADSNVATVSITVNAPPSVRLTVAGISPNVVSQNTGRTTFVVSGTGFVTGASVAFANGAGPAPHVVGVTWDSSTQLRVVADIKSGGPRKNRVWDVQVTNPDGSAAAGVRLLTITP